MSSLRSIAASPFVIAVLIVSSTSPSRFSSAGWTPPSSSLQLVRHRHRTTTNLPHISSYFFSSNKLRRRLIKMGNSSDEDAVCAKLCLRKVTSPQKRTPPPKASSAPTSAPAPAPAPAPTSSANNHIRRSDSVGVSTSSSSHNNDDVYPLTLVSWNIAQTEPSYSAPSEIIRELEAPRMIRNICLLQYSLSSSSSSSLSLPPQPDIIALQECPYPSFGQNEFGPYGYISAGTCASHCGYVDLLVRKELISSTAMLKAATTLEEGCEDGFSTPIRKRSRNQLNEEQEQLQNQILRIKTIPTYDLPSVAASITLPDSTKIAISSSHLMWSKEGASERKHQYTSLMKYMLQHSSNCILLGDFNMRTAEDHAAENALMKEDGILWIDAWKASPSGPIKYASKFTWDSFVNIYHEDGFQYRARYDRCYYRGEDILGVNKFDLVGNSPVENRKGDYLSDHFGMVVELGVKIKKNVPMNDDREQEEKAAKEDVKEGDDSDDDEVELLGVVKGGVLPK